MASIAQTLTDNNRLRGTLMAAISGMLYGMIGYFGIQLLNQEFSVPAMLFWRFFIAALWMFFIGLFSNKHHTLLLNCKPRTLCLLAGAGALCYSGCSAFYYLSSIYIGTGPAMVLFYAFPVFIILFSMIFDNWRMNKYTFAALLMVILGLILLNGRNMHITSLIGILYGLIAAFSYGIYVYTSQASSKKVDTHWLTLLICFGCALLFLALSHITDTFRTPHTTQAWTDILVLAIVATAIPIQLLLNGLKYISPIKASILSLLEPIVTVLVGMIFLHEKLVGLQALGIMIILFGALVIQFTDDTADADMPLK